jgi:hypothetical protein
MAEPVPAGSDVSPGTTSAPAAATSSRSARPTMQQARPRYRRLPLSTQRANARPHQRESPHGRRTHRRFGGTPAVCGRVLAAAPLSMRSRTPLRPGGRSWCGAVTTRRHRCPRRLPLPDKPGHAGPVPASRRERAGRRKQGAHDGRQIRVVHMQAAERGLSSDSRGARTDPALPEPLARFRGPLLVSAASGTQIESAPMATERKPPPSAAEFRFDPIVSGGPANRRTGACLVFALSRRGARTAEIPVGSGKQVAAGCQPTADREHERPSPACGSQGSGWITPLRSRVGPLPLAPSAPWRSPRNLG